MRVLTLINYIFHNKKAGNSECISKKEDLLMKKAAVFLGGIAILFGGISDPIQAKTLSQPKLQPQQLITQCPGGGYPVLVCEIVNGKRKCVRKCDSFREA